MDITVHGKKIEREPVVRPTLTLRSERIKYNEVVELEHHVGDVFYFFIGQFGMFANHICNHDFTDNGLESVFAAIN